MTAPLQDLAIDVAAFEEDRVLLVRREDFGVWCLPSGELEWGDSLAEAARRIALQVAGLDIEVDRLVGLYSRPWMRGYHTAAVFAGPIVGGVLYVDPEEFDETGMFTADGLPADLLWGQRERILDALAGRGGSIVRAIDTSRPVTVAWDRDELYAERDASDLERPAFYRSLVEAFGPDESVDELTRAPDGDA